MCARFRAVSGEHSVYPLLLNPPSCLCFSFTIRVSCMAIVAHFFPSHTLHLGLTFWAVPIMLTVGPSQGGLTTAVYRREEQEKVRLNGGYRL